MLTVFPDTWKTSFKAWFTIPSGKSPVPWKLSVLRPSGSQGWQTALGTGCSFKIVQAFHLCCFRAVFNAASELRSYCASKVICLSHHPPSISYRIDSLDGILGIEVCGKLFLSSASQVGGCWFVCLPFSHTLTSVGLCWKTDTYRHTDFSLSLFILSCTRELYHIYLGSLCAWE